MGQDNEEKVEKLLRFQTGISFQSFQNNVELGSNPGIYQENDKLLNLFQQKGSLLLFYHETAKFVGISSPYNVIRYLDYFTTTLVYHKGNHPGKNLHLFKKYNMTIDNTI